MVISADSENALPLRDEQAILREHQDGRWEIIIAVEQVESRNIAKKLLETSKNKNWFGFADSLDYKPVMRFQGIESKAEALQILSSHRITPTVETLENRGLTRPNITLRENSLRLSGLSELVGDAALVAGGLLGSKKNYYDAATGATYLASSAILTKYGKQTRSQKLENLSVSLKEYLNSQGVKLTQKDLNGKQVRTSGVINKIERYLYENPHQFRLLTNFIGAVSFLSGSIIKHNDSPQGLDKQTLRWKVGSGIVLCVASTLALVLPDDKKPLLISGSAGILSNTLLTISGVKEREAARADNKTPNRQEKLDYRSTYLTSLSFLASNAFFAASSKSGPIYESYEKETLATIAASMLAQESEQDNQPIIRKTAEFLAKKPGSQLSVDQLEKAISEKVEALRQHPILKEHVQSNGLTAL
jgi:hypothetical protein